MGMKMVYNFLGKDEKTRTNLCLLLLKTPLWKRSQTFFYTVYYPNNNHVTTHPVPLKKGITKVQIRLCNVMIGCSVVICMQHN